MPQLSIVGAPRRRAATVGASWVRAGGAFSDDGKCKGSGVDVAISPIRPASVILPDGASLSESDRHGFGDHRTNPDRATVASGAAGQTG